MSVTRILPALESGKSLIEAMCTIDRNLRPVKAQQVRRYLNKDFRDFYLANEYAQVFVKADKQIPHSELVAFAERNAL